MAPAPTLHMYPLAVRTTLQTEKAFVTGVEAANAVMKKLGTGNPADIIPLEPDEPHIQALRAANRQVKRAASLLPGVGRLLP